MHEVANEQKIGMWIDHKKAVLVFVDGATTTTKTMGSDVGPHHSTHAENGANQGGGEKKAAHRNENELHHYYDEVVKQIGHAKAVFICGPGEAKTELKSRMALTHGLAERIVGLESADHLTDGQVVAKVKEHFDLKR